MQFLRYLRRVSALFFTLTLLYVLLPYRLSVQITLQEVIDLTAKHNSPSAPRSEGQAEESAICGSWVYQVQMPARSAIDYSTDYPLSVEAPLLNADTIEIHFSKGPQNSLAKANETRMQELLFTRGHQSGPLILCAAVTYTQLATIISELEVLRLQQIAADRLVDIETRRLLADIDSPALLSRAKLFAARARKWTAALEATSLRLRKQLEALSGLSEERIDPIADSVPPLPELLNTDPEVRAILKEVSAARDVAQLEHVLARTQRMSTRGKMAVAKANLGDFVAACIAEYEKFASLLEADFELKKLQLELLDASGGLATWARDAAPKESLSALGAINQTMVAPIRGPVTTDPIIRSVMITPGVPLLVTGQPQQFSAIAIYNRGPARNATSQATWRCSSASKAILSPSGLLTALATGEVTISATVDGISQIRRITINAADPLP